jgi:DNA-binding NarL/FixJ family response regulator
VTDVGHLQRQIQDLRAEVKRLRRALRIRQLAQPELQAWLSNAAMLERLVTMSRDATPSTPTPAIPILKPIELEVLAALVDGETNPAIARRLYMSPHTASGTVARIYKKLGVHNRAGATMASIRYGLIRAGEEPDQ